MLSDLKKCNIFDGFLENDAAKEQVSIWFERENIPHAVFIVAEDGCGRNMFARMFCAAYLQDAKGLVARGVHPDCLVVEGEGASGNIPVARIRELAYQLNMAAVETDSRRVALIKNVKNLNKNSANALLKILEEPPDGVVFVLTSQYRDDVIETVRSRCVDVHVTAISENACVDHISKAYPDYSGERIANLCSVYKGRLGLIKRALESPERLAIFDCAGKLAAAIKNRDKLAILAQLDNARTRDDMKCLLFDAVMHIKREFDKDNVYNGDIERAADVLSSAMIDTDRYLNIKLLAAYIGAQL